MKEKKTLMDGRKNRPIGQFSSERSSEFVKELENLRDSFEENRTTDNHVSGRQNKIDPISKKASILNASASVFCNHKRLFNIPQPIRFPVKNSRCNHIYDKLSILDAIKMNSNLR